MSHIIIVSFRDSLWESVDFVACKSTVNAAGDLKNLSVLKLDCNHLLRIPDSIGKSGSHYTESCFFSIFVMSLFLIFACFG